FKLRKCVLLLFLLLCHFLFLSLVVSCNKQPPQLMLQWACLQTPHPNLCHGGAQTLSQLQRVSLQAVAHNLAHIDASVQAAPSRHGRSPAWTDCTHLHQLTKQRIAQVSGLVSPCDASGDAKTWLSAALANQRTCLDGLLETSTLGAPMLKNQTLFVSNNASSNRHDRRGPVRGSVHFPSWLSGTANWRLLVEPRREVARRAALVVAADGSGEFRTINEALDALVSRDRRRRRKKGRVVVYVKEGVYREHVEVGKELKDLVFVGDGIDKTVVTGNRNVPDGYTTFSSATFGVSADGFIARDMTFENTAGPQKHQAVALMVASDMAAFYRCSFRAHQDTLYLHSLMQFYKECDIYGTIDFVFGDATAVLQSCNIYIRRPMDHQSNAITAQGRDDPGENTGIVIHNSMVAADSRFRPATIKSYLGRPWKKYSRTVFMKTEIGGLIDPKGWLQWDGNLGLDTLYYGEYMNFGPGANTSGRVKWKGMHLIVDSRDASVFSVRSFLGGESGIPHTGVPSLPGI
ncbi:putative pectinesterase/pectinesterase inhibitor 36, partial [Nymphaea thermarum]